MSADSTIASNKQTVLDFYEAAFNAKDFDAVSRVVGDRYIQHNPLIADGVDGLQARLRDLKDAYPALRVSVQRLVAEDDHVVAHVHAVRVPGQRGTAIIDIFKLEDGKLVEHWDVLQEIPEEALNQNGMF
ncbi:nuclear transport factor 2 family protein [Actinomadura rudentiformis]|uniref:Polyketide cyclase n=1 Tax=Actinomadura rudentiformis TaxID=359158 RepID=A0A6H9YP16_9ACTN|nr:ester cyclase [Actinomadura rudentiformis]KAB2348895.1 polyketide cyclase [Actinomadura rudentiformis]